MTLDLGIRYEYVPPWLDKGGTLINAYLPYQRHRAAGGDLSRHPVLVRIGEGDFYEDSPIRFAPNIKVSRDGELGERLVDDDKKNFAPRRRLGLDPERAAGRCGPAPASSTCRTPATRASTWRATRPDAARTRRTRCG